MISYKCSHKKQRQHVFFVCYGKNSVIEDSFLLNKTTNRPLTNKFGATDILRQGRTHFR